MIGWLRGVVRVRDPLTGTVVLDVSGVGYQMTVSWQTFAGVPELGQTCELWVHTHAREDALLLFGFGSMAERRMFHLLLGVPQVGPKNALGVLGGLPLGELLLAIKGSERATLERIPGVGKRTAERILLDLQDKVEPLLRELGDETADTPARKAPAPSDDELLAEARDVLVNLGWKLKPVETALQKASGETPAPDSLDGLVRRALAILMGR